MPKSFLGFSLVELMVVVTIIAILSGAGFAVYGNLTKQSKDTQKKAAVEAVAKAYELSYDASTSSYRSLTNADFGNGQKPTSSDITYSQGPDAAVPDTTKFTICATLSDGSQYCRSSASSVAFTLNPTYTPTPTPTFTPTPTYTPTPTPTPAPVIYNLASSWQTVQGPIWYFYTVPIPTAGSSATSSMIYGHNPWASWAPSLVDWYRPNSWAYVQSLDRNNIAMTGDNNYDSIVFWKAPVRGLATITVNMQRYSWATSGNGSTFGIAAGASINSSYTLVKSINVPATDTSSKTLSYTRQVNTGDVLEVLFDSSIDPSLPQDSRNYHDPYNDDSSGNIIVSVIPN